MNSNLKTSFSEIMDILGQGEALYEKLLSIRDEDIDMIVCPAHIGDTISIAALASAYIKKHACKSVYYVVKKSQDEMVRHFPDIETTVVLTNEEMKALEHYIIAMKYYNHEHIIYAFLPAVLCIDFPSFRKIEFNDIGHETTMVERGKIWLSLDKDASVSRMTPPDSGHKEELKELFGNGILLMPASQTLENIPIDFWSRLAEAYSDRGYTVYTNYNGFSYETYIDNTIPLSTTIMELAEIAPCFVQIISQRSGICDLLAEVESNLSIVYYGLVNERRILLSKDELGVENIYELVDRSNLLNYQYMPELESELVDALIQQGMKKQRPDYGRKTSYGYKENVNSVRA